jgi:uncharacterized protein
LSIVSDQLTGAARAALVSFVVTTGLFCPGGLSVLVAAGLVMTGVSSSTAQAPLKQEQLTLVTATGDVTISVEIAQTSEQKAKGLMFRKSLDDRAGMLFPYGQPQEITMWMKNTYIALDMVFIRGDGTIHRIEAMTEPFSEATVASQGPVAAVLELNGGAAARLGLKAGDKARHAVFTTTYK